MARSAPILLALTLLVASQVAISNAQQPCVATCGQYRVTDVLTRAHLATAPSIVVDHAGSPPVWWDDTWLNHLIAAGNAFSAAGMNVSYISGGYQNIEVILVGHQEFWPDFLPTNLLAHTDLFLGNGYVQEKRIWVNLFYWDDAHWFEEWVGGPVYPQHDLATVLVHEIGHAFGFAHLNEDLEYCTVMTENTAPTEVRRSLHPFDIDGLICYYPTVSVGDIQSFSVQGSGHNVNLSFEIAAHPNEYAAVYVSDNSAGPARLIGLLTDHAELVPSINHWVDSYRLPPAGQYYYWLDHSSFSGNDLLRSPNGLYASATPATVTGTGSTSFDPPDILAVADVPFDLGGKILVTWQASADESSIDYYNIYRNTYPPGQAQSGWKYLISVSRGVTSYLDQSVVNAWVNEYRVSAAHHGNYALEPGRGNQGIWNEMSSPVYGAAANNFATDQITLLSNETLAVCPAGDAATLQAEIIVWSSTPFGPTVGIPPELIECYPQNEFAGFCDGEPMVVDGPTDAAGRTTLTTSAIGGSGLTDLVFKIADSVTYAPTFLDTLTVYLKSPDENGDDVVDVIDFAAWSASYPSPPNPYAWQRDYDGNGVINVVDWNFRNGHLEHQCSGGSLTPSPFPALSDVRVQVDFAETVSATEDRYLYGDVSVTNLSRFKAMLFHLRSDNPTLEFIRWESGAFGGRVLVAPIVRDGVGEIAFGVLDGENLQSDALVLGRMVFRINSREDLNLTSRDFETRVAQLLSPSGSVFRLAGAATSDTRQIPRIVADAVAQNRPNPFNPTTIISYSISKPGRVGLLVFAVDGKLVRTLVDGDQQSDSYDVVWDGTDNQGQRVASGVYFYQLKTPLFAATKKMVLLK